MEDLDSRLSFLVESVQEEHGIKTHRRKRSVGERVLTRLKQFGHHNEILQVTVSLGDDDPDSQRLKESDSIQRAMADIYRTAKLLHNFAILNYTGFVKIVKKHDKTFKEYKGKYKSLIEASNVCNEGKDVEMLSDKMVRKLFVLITLVLPASHLVIARRRNYTPTGFVTEICR